MKSSDLEKKVRQHNVSKYHNNDTRDVYIPPRTAEEDNLLKQLRKNHRKDFKKLFGTKRPTAGIVRQYYRREYHIPALKFSY